MLKLKEQTAETEEKERNEEMEGQGGALFGYPVFIVNTL